MQTISTFTKTAIIFITLNICIHQTLSAQKNISQTKIKAIVVDSVSKKGIAFATLSLLKMPEKNIIHKMITADNGKFELYATSGEYKLQIYSLGYLLKDIDFIAKEGEKEIDLGEIGLPVSSVKLNEVNIIAEKPLVTIDADKISYNTESDPDSKTLTALEMMRKVPLLSIDGDDNVQLKGSSNFKYLLNGKPSTMLSSNAKEFLKSLPASAIKNIEVITSPGAKYDAEGVNGIINIITQTKSLNGYTCSLNAGADSQGGINGGMYLATSIKKITFSTSLYYNTYKHPWYENITRRENLINNQEHLLLSEGKSKFEGQFPYNSTELSYEIDTLNLISGSFNFWKGINQSNTQSDVKTNSIDNTLTQAYLAKYDYDYSYGDAEGNIDYQKTFKHNKEQILTLSYKLSSGKSSSNGNINIDSIYALSPSKKINTNKEKENEYTYQMDYVQPLDKIGKLEIGAKYIQRINAASSSGQIFLFNEQQFVDNVAEFTDFEHRTNITAAYLTYSKKIKNLGIASGIRAENALTKALFHQEQNADFKNESLELVPSAALSYKINQSHNIKLAYNKRIQRPSIWYLNPRVNNNDPKNIHYGNPNLKPEHFHNFELSYSLFSQKGNINLSTSYSFSDNGIDRLVWVDDNGIFYSTYRNMSKTQSYTQNLYTNLSINKNFRLGLNITAVYTDVESNIDENTYNNGWGFRSNGWMQYTIIKGLKLTTYGGYFKNNPSLQSSYSAHDYSGVNLTKYFLKDKLTITFGVNDFYYDKKKWEYERWTAYAHQKTTNYRPGRSYRLGISFRFGELNSQVKKANKSIENDDIKKGSENGGNNGN